MLKDSECQSKRLPHKKIVVNTSIAHNHTVCDECVKQSDSGKDSFWHPLWANIWWSFCNQMEISYDPN